MNLYCSFVLSFEAGRVGYVGDYEAGQQPCRVAGEIPLTPPQPSNQRHYLALGQCMVGSLTGAVSSQKVTEEHKGTLSTVGNRAESAMA